MTTGLTMDTRITCAIHQPNLFPRLSTLIKLYTADIWVVLDDVQFNHRDYQHRTRLAILGDEHHHRWLSLPAHKPFGRATRINEVLLLEPHKSARRTRQLVQHYYNHAPRWSEIHRITQDVAALIEVGTRLADITELSTRILLEHLDWPGHIVRASTLTARPERSARLADLTLATGADVYLCGTGGAKYLDETPFTHHGIDIRYLTPPQNPPWHTSHTISALSWIAEMGRTTLSPILGPINSRVGLPRKAVARLRTHLSMH